MLLLSSAQLAPVRLWDVFTNARGHKTQSLAVLSDLRPLFPSYMFVSFGPQTEPWRYMKAARDVEAVELMIASNKVTGSDSAALLMAKTPAQCADYKPP